jgi:hypothetical protein
LPVRERLAAEVSVFMNLPFDDGMWCVGLVSGSQAILNTLAYIAALITLILCGNARFAIYSSAILFMHVHREKI